MRNLRLLSLMSLSMFSLTAHAFPNPAIEPDPVHMDGAGNNIQVINHGLAALAKRFEMIDHAQSHIDVEYFIYNPDRAGKLFTLALLKKKREMNAANKPMKIRIILDASQTVLKMKAANIRALNDAFRTDFDRTHPESAFEIKYYNTTPLLNFKDMKKSFMNAQFRDHRKLLSVDGPNGEEAITGSRNIADEYFDLSDRYNFRDRDIYVAGPMANSMHESFDRYWNASEITVPARAAKDPVPPKTYVGGYQNPILKSRYDSAMAKLKTAREFVVETSQDVAYNSAIRQISAKILANPESKGTCEKLTYVTDKAGFQSEQTRGVLPELLGRMREMKSGEELIVESPYFIIHGEEAENMMKFLKENKIKGTLLTNSLNSTDAFYVAAVFNLNLTFYKTLTDAKMYVYKGETPKDTKDFITFQNGKRLTEKARWGIHSKTFVFGEKSFATGTFNVDPRSAGLNSEMLLFCEGNDHLTKFVTDDIRARITQADYIDEHGKLANGKSLTDGASMGTMLKYDLSMFPATWAAGLL